MYSRRRGEDEWREIVAEFDASGLTQEVFARKRRLNVGTFRSWIYRIRGALNKPRFVEVVKATTSVEDTLAPKTTLLVGDARVEFGERPEAEYVVALLRGLAEVTS